MKKMILTMALAISAGLLTPASAQSQVKKTVAKKTATAKQKSSKATNNTAKATRSSGTEDGMEVRYADPKPSAEELNNALLKQQAEDAAHDQEVKAKQEEEAKKKK